VLPPAVDGPGAGRTRDQHHHWSSACPWTAGSIPASIISAARWPPPWRRTNHLIPTAPPPFWPEEVRPGASPGTRPHRRTARDLPGGV